MPSTLVSRGFHGITARSVTYTVCKMPMRSQPLAAQFRFELDRWSEPGTDGRRECDGQYVALGPIHGTDNPFPGWKLKRTSR